MISVLLADDHDIVRQGIRRLLEREPTLQVCGEAQDGREAVRMAKELKPRVVILDLSMPELNGLDAARQIRGALPDTEVLIFTMHRSEQLVREVVAAGARGYVLKSDPARDLVSAVQEVAEHRPFFTTPEADPSLRESGPANVEGAERDASRDPLTQREREVVQLLAEGRSNKEVAATLDISVKTAETHRATIMRKLGLSSVVDLVHYAIRNKIIEP